MFTAAKINTIFHFSKLFRVIVRIMSDFLYFCTHKAPKKPLHQFLQRKAYYLQIMVASRVISWWS